MSETKQINQRFFVQEMLRIIYISHTEKTAVKELTFSCPIHWKKFLVEYNQAGENIGLMYSSANNLINQKIHYISLVLIHKLYLIDSQAVDCSAGGLYHDDQTVIKANSHIGNDGCSPF